MAPSANHLANNHLACRKTADGITLRVRLTPKASRDQVQSIIDTPDGQAIRASVRAPPADGAANRAVIALFAKWLKVPKSTVSLAAGSRSRIKTLHVAGDGHRLLNNITQILTQWS